MIRSPPPGKEPPDKEKKSEEGGKEKKSIENKKTEKELEQKETGEKETGENQTGEWQTQQSRSTKRKMSSPPQITQFTKQSKKGADYINEKFLALVNLSVDIDYMARTKYNNTKTEIKVSGEQMKLQTTNLYKLWTEEIADRQNETEKLKDEIRTLEAVNGELNKLVEQLEREKTERFISPEKLEQKLNSIQSIEDAESLVGIPWGPNTYKHTKTTTKNILNTANIKVIMVSENNTKDKETITRLSAIYPAFGKAINRAPTDKTLKLHIKEDIIEGDENNEENTNTDNTPKTQQIILTKLSGTTKKELIKAAKTLLNDIDDTEQSVLIHMTHEADIDTSLKIVECCLRGKELKAEVCAKGRGIKKRNNDRIRRENLNTLIVKNQQGKTYAETLKSIKAAVVPEEKGATIKKIGKTKDGNIVIKIRDDTPGASEEVAKAINKGASGSAEVKQTAKIQILIHDIDEATEKEEIEKAIRDEAGADIELTVHDPTPNKNGNFTAKVLMPKNYGQHMIEKGTLKIGWFNSRVTEKITIPICYNCLKLGHLGTYCREPRVEKKRCYKCASDKHEASSCDQEPHCMECNEKGHIVNSFNCPAYKKLIQERITRNRNRKTELTYKKHD